MSCFDTQKFWKDINGSDVTEPIKEIVRPEFFIDESDITGMIVSTLSRYLDKDASIIELGCGSGRDLAGLKEAGFNNLMGVEINQDAISMGRKKFPALEKVYIHNAPIEDVIKTLPKVDCIYTVGVLMHMPPESDWIHSVISNKAQKIIMTMEMEFPFTHPITLGGEIFTWGRGSYEKIFHEFGWMQVEGHSCENIRILSKNHWLRVYRKVG